MGAAAGPDSTKAIMSEDQNTDVPPNHLSIDPRSPFYSEEILGRDVGIRFNGVEKTNVFEGLGESSALAPVGTYHALHRRYTRRTEGSP